MFGNLLTAIATSGLARKVVIKAKAKSSSQILAAHIAITTKSKTIKIITQISIEESAQLVFQSSRNFPLTAHSVSLWFVAIPIITSNNSMNGTMTRMSSIEFN